MVRLGKLVSSTVGFDFFGVPAGSARPIGWSKQPASVWEGPKSVVDQLQITFTTLETCNTYGVRLG